jgi:L-ascorbate metabolism protein UlaG (beta-lactamase superfamily)
MVKIKVTGEKSKVWKGYHAGLWLEFRSGAIIPDAWFTVFTDPFVSNLFNARIG